MQTPNLIRLLVIEAVMLVAQVVLYFGCEVLQHDFHDVKRPIDDKVPLVPWSTLIYVTWFPLIAVCPITLYYGDPQAYIAYQAAILFSNIVSTAAYLIYPTTFYREPVPETAGGKLLRLVYTASFKGVNCAPSLHCSQCMIVIALSCLCGGLPIWLKLLYITLAAGIIVSTQLTKQHVLVDALTAVPVAIAAVIFGIGIRTAWAGTLLAALGL